MKITPEAKNKKKKKKKNKEDVQQETCLEGRIEVNWNVHLGGERQRGRGRRGRGAEKGTMKHKLEKKHQPIKTEKITGRLEAKEVQKKRREKEKEKENKKKKKGEREIGSD